MDALNSANASTAGSNGAGSVVALNPNTGAVLAMASTPGFDPNAVANTKTFSKLNTDKSAPLVDRADPEPLPTGIDDEGRHRHGGARQRRLHARHDSLGRARRLTISGAPLANDDNDQIRRRSTWPPPSRTR